MYLINSWEFEPHIFDLENGQSYLPDFQVQSMDGSIAYHEVKGYMSDVAQDKLNRMPEVYPKVNIVLVDSDVYKTLEHCYSARIQNWEGING